MNVKTVSVTYERKFNLGDYQSGTFGVTLWADLDEGENEDEAMHALWGMAKANVKAAAMPVVQNLPNGQGNEYMRSAFLGVPLESDETE
jgi:hypothetical protein